MTAYRDVWQRIKFVGFLTLLVMLLMRLVWMELRTYSIEIDTRGLITLRFLQENQSSRCVASAWNLLGPTKAPVRVERLPEVGLAGYWMSSPGIATASTYLCLDDTFDSKRLVRMNQWLLISTLFLATLLVRFVTGSWLLAVGAAVAIMNRGRIVADIGTFSAGSPLALITMLWFAAAAHFFRTGSLISLTVSGFALIAGSLFDRPFILLGLAFPLLVLALAGKRRLHTLAVLRALRRDRQAAQALQPSEDNIQPAPWITRHIRFKEAIRIMVGAPMPGPLPRTPQWQVIYERGGLFARIRVPFAVWVFKRHRAPQLAGFGVFMTLAALVGVLALAASMWWTFGGGDLMPFWRALDPKLGGQVAQWVRTMWASPVGRMDTYMFMSLVCLVLCAWRSPISGAFEAPVFARFFLLSAALLLAGAFLADYVDSMVLALLHKQGQSLQVPPIHRTLDVFLWLEPSLLAAGIAAVWQLLSFPLKSKY